MLKLGLLISPNLNKPFSTSNATTNATVFWLSNLKKEDIRLEDRKISLTISSSFSVTSLKECRLSMLVKNFYRTKGSKTTLIILCQIISTTDWHPFLKRQEELAFSWRLIAYRKSPATFLLEKGQEIRDYRDVKWLSDHLIYTIEKRSWK